MISVDPAPFRDERNCPERLRIPPFAFLSRSHNKQRVERSEEVLRVCGRAWYEDKVRPNMALSGNSYWTELRYNYK